MKKIAVVTATRAEFGLLAPLVNELRRYESDDFRVELVVTGTHLYAEYGNTIDEIKSQGIRIDHTVKVSVASESEADISANQADVLMQFTRIFLSDKYNGIVILGDRYEMLAVAMAAGNTRTPIFHLCGGDTTEGAMDEWIRHSITKMSYLHFVTNEDSKKRVIQLGEHPDRVFNYGSTSVDNSIIVATMSKDKALASIGLEDCKYALCTYHPVTMDGEAVDILVYDLLEAVKVFPDIEFIFTKSNADQGGLRINEILDDEEKNIPNLHVFTSLGVKRYLSLMRYCELVLGNSSSGIIEAPVFKVPTVNIGDRQRGRLQTESIINCDTDTKSIANAIKKAISKEFKLACENVVSPYGEGHAARDIAKTIVDVVLNKEIDLKKKFFDIVL